MGSIDKDTRTDFDVIVVGAGISGINTAYRLQTELPKYTFTILEGRGALGGTWDLFRYPGIRSDSDLHTFGFYWRPWPEQQAIADAASIRKYLRESAEEFGIDKKIRFHHKLLAADWSSDDQRWTLEVLDPEGEKIDFTARFVVFGTGYYNYNEPLKTHIPGLENFKGQIVHPQFWPEDLDYTNKKVVIIGSGATAVTLLPAIAQKAARVTMLQRSPTYILALPSVDTTGNLMRRWLPKWLAFKLVRWKFLVLPFLFFKFCKTFPNAARWILKKGTMKELPEDVALNPNFIPRYNPWEQRLCVCPDGDFYKALRDGKADIVTDTIKTVTEHGIETDNGTILDADIIVTATGLKIALFGLASITMNRQPIDIPSKFVWRSAMVQDIPNAALILGYTNASWTLGADTTAHLVCRLLKYMDSKKLAVATPKTERPMTRHNVLSLSSTYLELAKGEIPKAGDRKPWMGRENYFLDLWWGMLGVTQDLEFEKEGLK